MARKSAIDMSIEKMLFFCFSLMKNNPSDLSTIALCVGGSLVRRRVYDYYQRMQAVILAAGRGRRLGDLTQDTPKSLIHVVGKPILECTLSALPSEVSEVVLVVGYLGDKLKNHIGGSYHDLSVRYVESELLGTGWALWQARQVLKPGKLLVLNGDDLYDKKELEFCTSHELALGLSNSPMPSPNYITIEVDNGGLIKGHRRPDPVEVGTNINLATGAYVLDHRIFDYDLVKLSNGEYGLPQTILKMAKDHPVRGVFMKSWHQINTPEDIKKAEKILAESIF